MYIRNPIKGKFLPTRKARANALRKEMEMEDLYICDFCGEQFKTSQGLGGHKRSVHSISFNELQKLAKKGGEMEDFTKEAQALGISVEALKVLKAAGLVVSKPAEPAKVVVAEEPITFEAPEQDWQAELPIGLWLCEVEEVKKTTAKTGSPQLQWNLKLLEGMPGRVFAYFTSLVPGSLWVVRKMLDILGVKYTRSGNNISFFPSECIGKKVKILIAKHSYGGTIRHKPVQPYTLETQLEEIEE